MQISVYNDEIHFNLCFDEFFFIHVVVTTILMKGLL